MHIVTVDEMRELEARADKEYGLNSSILMENAGRSAAEILMQHVRPQRSASEAEFLILVGPGNNGGDGKVMGRYLEKTAPDSAWRGCSRSEHREQAGGNHPARGVCSRCLAGYRSLAPAAR